MAKKKLINSNKKISLVGNELDIKYPIFCINASYFEQKKDGTLCKTSHQVLTRKYGTNVKHYVKDLIGYVNEPSNIDYKQIIDDHYNSYKKPPHDPVKGDWSIIKEFLDHVFQDQYKMGIEYFWNLYLHPKQKLPFLGIVSLKKRTGKTTFINFIHLMFGGNAAVITAHDLYTNFNLSYASALVSTSDEHNETKDRKNIAQKLKNLITAENIRVEPKGVNSYTINFFGKFVFASNDENMLTFIEDVNTRYWIIKLNSLEKTIYNFEEQLKKQIPAFLYYLKYEFEARETRGRLYFNPDEFENEASRNIQANSKSAKYLEIQEALMDYFESCSDCKKVKATPNQLTIYLQDNKKAANYIRSVLKEEFKMKTQKSHRYIDINQNSSNGTPFVFLRENFVCDPATPVIEDDELPF